MKYAIAVILPVLVVGLIVYVIQRDVPPPAPPSGVPISIMVLDTRWSKGTPPRILQRNNANNANMVMRDGLPTGETEPLLMEEPKTK